MYAAAITRGDILVKNVIPKHLESISAKLEEIGCSIEEYDDAVRVTATGELQPTHIKTLPYPGYPTDLQPQAGVALALADGVSTITESIFESRFKYVDELARMGANVRVEGNTAIIDGVSGFSGAHITAPDLRAGAALVLAALSAEGTTVIDNVRLIERGYEDFDQKIRELGGDIIKTADVKQETKRSKFKVVG